MAEEEFQESDVLWPEPDQGHFFSTNARSCQRHLKAKAESRNGLLAPVDVSGEAAQSSSWAPGVSNNGFEDSGGGLVKEEEMIPPHVLVARRASERIAFSMCTGNGRTLKGRDIRRVRNSVLQMTGFLEN